MCTLENFKTPRQTSVLFLRKNRHSLKMNISSSSLFLQTDLWHFQSAMLSTYCVLRWPQPPPPPRRRQLHNNSHFELTLFLPECPTVSVIMLRLHSHLPQEVNCFVFVTVHMSVFMCLRTDRIRCDISALSIFLHSPFSKWHYFAEIMRFIKYKYCN